MRPLADKTFVAIDFETADHGPDSACAVGLVRVERLQIVRREKVLIRPPRPRVWFTSVHGITWPMVADSPVFGEVWPGLSSILHGADFFAAHNASFDRGVLVACCRRAKLPVPTLPFKCTVQVARKTWDCRPANLPSVCRRLGIPLIHHDPLSDAEASARIVIASAFAGSSKPRPTTPGLFD